MTALLAGSLLAALVWHATQIDPVDAWVMRWQETAYSHAVKLAASVSASLKPVVVAIVVGVIWEAAYGR